MSCQIDFIGIYLQSYSAHHHLTKIHGSVRAKITQVLLSVSMCLKTNGIADQTIKSRRTGNLNSTHQAILTRRVLIWLLQEDPKRKPVPAADQAFECSLIFVRRLFQLIKRISQILFHLLCGFVPGFWCLFQLLKWLSTFFSQQPSVVFFQIPTVALHIDFPIQLCMEKYIFKSIQTVDSY